jgi:hypothetical protein
MLVVFENSIEKRSSPNLIPKPVRYIRANYTIIIRQTKDNHTIIGVRNENGLARYGFEKSSLAAVSR